MAYIVVKRSKDRIEYRQTEQGNRSTPGNGEILLVLPTREIAQVFADAWGRDPNGARYPITVEETTTFEISSDAAILDAIAHRTCRGPMDADRIREMLKNPNAPQGEREASTMKLYLYAIVETFKPSNGEQKTPTMLQDTRYAFASDAEMLKRRVMMTDVCALLTKPTDVDNVRVVILSETAIG